MKCYNISDTTIGKEIQRVGWLSRVDKLYIATIPTLLPQKSLWNAMSTSDIIIWMT